MVNILDQLKSIFPHTVITKRVPIRTKPLGTSGTEIYSGYFDEEYLQKIKGLRGAELYDEMRRSDSQIAMLLSVVKNPIKSAKWTVQAASNDDKETEIKEFIEHCLFNDISNPETGKRKTFKQLITEVLTFCEFGYSAFEVIHKKVKDHHKYGDYIGLQDISFRSQKTIEQWFLRRDGSIDYVRQSADGDLHSYVDIPGENMIVFSMDKEGDNYEGISLIRPCYGNFFRKQNYLKFLAIGIETSSKGIPYGKVTEDIAGRDDYEDQYDAALEMLEQFAIHENRAFIMPKGFEIDSIKLQFDAEKVQKVIDSEDIKMSKRFLANFMELGLSGSGSYSLGSDLSDIFLSGIEFIADIICERINADIIPTLVKAKYGFQKNYPKLVCRGINDKAGKEIAEIISLLTDRGIILPDERLRDYVHDIYGLPEVKADESKTTQKQKPLEEDGFTVDPENITDIEADETISEFPAEIKLLEEKAYAETNMIPPKKAQQNAKRGLELRRKWNRGGTEIGVARARDLSNGASLSRDTIARMAAFARHEQNYRPEIREPDGGHTAGTIAWLLWGGSEGVEWAKKTLEKLDKRLNDLVTFAEPEISKMRPSVFIDRKAKDLRVEMESRLLERSDLMIESVKSILEGKGSEVEKADKVLKITMPKSREYKEYMLNTAAEIAKAAMTDAAAELDAVKKLSEKDFKDLPRRTRERLKREIELLARYQDVDMEKFTSFVVSDELSKKTPVSKIIDNIKKQRNRYLAGALLSVAATNLVSKIVNSSRNDVYQDPKFSSDIESFVFVNHDPKSDICKNLNGRVFSKEEYESTDNLPPLHHNCKSYIVAQTKGKKGNKPIDPKGLTPSGTDEELDKIFKSKTI